MILKVMKDKWINFRCDACLKPVQIQLDSCEKVVCGCGWLHSISDLKSRIAEKEDAVT